MSSASCTERKRSKELNKIDKHRATLCVARTASGYLDCTSLHFLAPPTEEVLLMSRALNENKKGKKEEKS